MATFWGEGCVTNHVQYSLASFSADFPLVSLPARKSNDSAFTDSTKQKIIKKDIIHRMRIRMYIN
jgi:hypothetical protein